MTHKELEALAEELKELTDNDITWEAIEEMARVCNLDRKEAHELADLCGL